ncbi:hypothetical protein HMPREF9104_03313 [Lentilactobacillus kisonensis F0435]|uniref:Uncharacterized protein n=1 Tax=Lentilactobacillus kisonensis F0435 TaxID=797516 RepID=H1LL07_9LACO|nr:hypothetical protein HMPREF9104_03313 [Lentilactobacillus kisonensis F0435]
MPIVTWQNPLFSTLPKKKHGLGIFINREYVFLKKANLPS